MSDFPFVILIFGSNRFDRQEEKKEKIYANRNKAISLKANVRIFAMNLNSLHKKSGLWVI